MLRCPLWCGRRVAVKQKKAKEEDRKDLRWTMEERERNEEVREDRQKVEDMVPKWFHKWLKVFGKQDSERMPVQKPLLWKLWILQSYSWRTRHSSTIFATSKQKGSILISLLHYHLLVQTLIKSFIYPFEEQLLIVTFLVTDSNRLLTWSSFFSFIRLPCNTQ